MKKKLLTAVIICQVCFLMLGKDESKNETGNECSRENQEPGS